MYFDWIDIKERLPEKDEPVMCLYDDDYMDIMEYWYDDENGNPIFMRPPSPSVDNVKFWIPLPEKPTPR
jgi:hypothetical protein